MVRRALAQAGDTLSLTDILTLVERIREHEKTQPLAARGPWQASRASAHLVLARRGSRIALYDLRETVERAKEPMAMEFLAALNALGDASCVEALAKAYASTGDRWWRGHLVQTFRTIVGRAGLTRRHAAIRRLKERDPRVFGELWPRRRLVGLRKPGFGGRVASQRTQRPVGSAIRAACSGWSPGSRP